MSGGRERLTIDALAVGGDGVAHVGDGSERRAVFAARTAVGDVIDAVIDRRSRPWRAREFRVVEASAHRREPPCPFAAPCGGCPWMHLDAAGRAEGRRAIVDASLGRVLGAIPTTFHEAPVDVGYRTRARFAVRGGENPQVGFRASGGHHLVPIDRCLVLDRRLDPIVPLLRAILKRAAVQGEAQVALGRGDRPVLALTLRGDLPPGSFATIERAVNDGAIGGALLASEGARTPARIGDPTVVTIAADGGPLELPPNGFAQAHVAMSRTVGATAAALLPEAAKRVVELYAGAGNLTTLLARGRSGYVAVESDAAACLAAQRNLAARGLDVRVVTADASDVPLPKALDAIVLDPPRTGAPKLADRVAKTKTKDVVYVSCDPVTLARDAERLLAVGFSARALHVFDMFPQTAHLEAALHLSR